MQREWIWEHVTDRTQALLRVLNRRDRRRTLLIAAVGFWLPAVVFLRLANEILEPEPLWFDNWLLTSLHAHASAALDFMALMAADLGGTPGVATIGMLSFGLYLFYRKLSSALIILFGLGGAVIVNMLLKLSFDRSRPDLWVPIVSESSFSFPSGHAMASSALAFSLIAVLWPTRFRWWVIVVGSIYTICIGLSRVYLGVHYPSDVLAGWAVSAAWVYLVSSVVRRRRK